MKKHNWQWINWILKILSPLTGQSGVSKMTKRILLWCRGFSEGACVAHWTKSLSSLCCPRPGQEQQLSSWNLKAETPSRKPLFHLYVSSFGILSPRPSTTAWKGRGVMLERTEGNCEQPSTETESASRNKPLPQGCSVSLWCKDRDSRAQFIAN